MQLYTVVDFKGHWAVGTSLLVLAENTVEAIASIEAKLREIGLPQEILPKQLTWVDKEKANTIILTDGDY